MRKTKATTPLLQILRDLETDDRRQEFADLAGTTTAYLYQLGGCNRKSCRADLAAKIEKASLVMCDKYFTTPIDMMTLATMCNSCAVDTEAG